MWSFHFVRPRLPKQQISDNKEIIRLDSIKALVVYIPINNHDLFLDILPISANHTIIIFILQGNLGGTFGLFLGMSCLTVLEFVDFVFRRIYHWFKKRKIGKPRVQTSRVG